MDLLKVKELSRIICDTNMGVLKLRLRKGEDKYQFTLDAIELPKDLNTELMEAIYPKKVETPKFTGFDPITELPVHKADKFIEKIRLIKPKGRPKTKNN